VLQFLRRLEAEGPRARPEQVDDGRQQQRHLYRFLKKRDSEVRLLKSSLLRVEGTTRTAMHIGN
jgi:hypothetical protein